MDELKEIGKILITESELSILQKYNIAVSKCASIDEVLVCIDRMLNEAIDLTDEEYDEVDYVANQLMERKYYMETRK
ncbi:MAG: hypothetical protein K2M17_04340 [Bacilli bacterium]|nr:hypothetical protein [Bacilli bacterium]